MLMARKRLVLRENEKIAATQAKMSASRLQLNQIRRIAALNKQVLAAHGQSLLLWKRLASQAGRARVAKRLRALRQRPRAALLDKPAVAPAFGRPAVAPAFGRPAVALVGKPAVALVGKPEVALVGKPAVVRVADAPALLPEALDRSTTTP
jgi:hypothetical protein